jgi:hypothetical protein
VEATRVRVARLATPVPAALAARVVAVDRAAAGRVDEVVRAGVVWAGLEVQALAVRDLAAPEPMAPALVAVVPAARDSLPALSAKTASSVAA